MAGEFEARMNQPAPPSRSAQPPPGTERDALATHATGDSDTELPAVPDAARDAARNEDALHELSSTRVIGDATKPPESGPHATAEPTATETKKIVIGGDFQLLKK